MGTRATAALLAVGAAVVMGVLSWLRNSQPGNAPVEEHAAPVHHLREHSHRPMMQDASLIERLDTQGSSSVMEIVDMLRSGVNYPTHVSEEGEEWATFPTVRTALLAMLVELGGDEAARCAEQVAETTSDSLELGLCMRILEEQEPGRHRDLLVIAARRMLARDTPDEAPLLQLLAVLEASDAVADIERVAAKDRQNSEPAVLALVSMRRLGGNEALKPKLG